MGDLGSDPSPRAVGLAPLQLLQRRPWASRVARSPRLPPLMTRPHLLTTASGFGQQQPPARKSLRRRAGDAGAQGTAGSPRAHARRTPGSRVREGWAAGQRTGWAARTAFLTVASQAAEERDRDTGGRSRRETARTALAGEGAQAGALRGVSPGPRRRTRSQEGQPRRSAGWPLISTPPPGGSARPDSATRTRRRERRERSVHGSYSQAHWLCVHPSLATAPGSPSSVPRPGERSPGYSPPARPTPTSARQCGQMALYSC